MRQGCLVMASIYSKIAIQASDLVIWGAAEYGNPEVMGPDPQH